MPDIANDPRFDLLTLIADENLGIETLEPTGKPTVDLRLVSVEHLARALQTAYDAGLTAGYRLSNG
jgi:hypothetical protein